MALTPESFIYLENKPNQYAGRIKILFQVAPDVWPASVGSQVTKDTPAVFDEILADDRHGTIDTNTVRSRIADVLNSHPSLWLFKKKHLSWTDHDYSVEWI